MKDFIFSDPSESTKTVVFRTDLIGNGENFTIHTITGLADTQSYNSKKQMLLAPAFKRIPATKGAFIAFALLRGLTLVLQDSNGENPVVLVAYNSDSLAQSW